MSWARSRRFIAEARVITVDLLSEIDFSLDEKGQWQPGVDDGKEQGFSAGVVKCGLRTNFRRP